MGNRFRESCRVKPGMTAQLPCLFYIGALIAMDGLLKSQEFSNMK
jgi:hypothetical protein